MARGHVRDCPGGPRAVFTLENAMNAREVYLLYTTNQTLGWVRELLAIYSKSSYQQAYNRLADIAERYPAFGKYPMVGEGKTVLAVTDPASGQRWWLERHELI